MDFVTLNNGLKMPVLGFSVFRIPAAAEGLNERFSFPYSRAFMQHGWEDG
jgi:diketogulonate reductase-like aldo/keto reductase